MLLIVLPEDGHKKQTGHKGDDRFVSTYGVIFHDGRGKE